MTAQGSDTRVRDHWGVAIAALAIVAALFAISFPIEGRINSVVIFAAVLFVPTFIASLRSHKNATAIFVLNLLTFAGVMLQSRFYREASIEFVLLLALISWVITMVWSFTANREQA
jgi:hypothetical protein